MFMKLAAGHRMRKLNRLLAKPYFELKFLANLGPML